MLLSMTSYGRASRLIQDRRIVVEIKTINSKYLDLRVKLPPNFHEKEMEIRKIISDHIYRGKAEVAVSYETDQGGEYLGVNKSLFKMYFRELQGLTEETGISDDNMLTAILRLPEVVGTSEEALTPMQWELVISAIDEALQKLQSHREQEGQAMSHDMAKRINRIKSLLEDVTPLESERIRLVKERMMNSLAEFRENNNVDENRYEQEVLHYLEKLDINEEKVRLKQHCDFFLDVLHSDKMIKGKKLNFISQEIGREINTLGAKAHFSEIQKVVVEMKDELEKVKEQLSNTV